MGDPQARLATDSSRGWLIALAACALAIAAPLLWIQGSRTAERKAAEAREAEMQRALRSMRGEIARFHRTHGRYPRALRELGMAIPPDPVTRSGATWQVTTEEVVTPSTDFSTAGSTRPESVIVDVRSGAPGQDSRGRPWSSY